MGPSGKNNNPNPNVVSMSSSSSQSQSQSQSSQMSQMSQMSQQMPMGRSMNMGGGNGNSSSNNNGGSSSSNQTNLPSPASISQASMGGFGGNGGGGGDLDVVAMGSSSTTTTGGGGGGPSSSSRRSQQGGSSGGGGSGGHAAQQQLYIPQRLNGEWQSNRDMKTRREMIQHIVRLLKQKDRNAGPEWLHKLPQMVKQLEVSLYRSAPSFEAYCDISTLKHRLQLLAVEIAKKTDRGGKGSSPTSGNLISLMGGGGGGSRSDASGSSSRHGGGSSSSSRQQQYHQQQRGQNQPMPPPQMSGGIVNMNDINPMMSGSGSRGRGSGGGGGGGGGGMMPVNPSSSSGQYHPQQQPPPHHGSSSSHRSGRSRGSLSEDDMLRTRHKQQRLLLLHHASKCPHEDGSCPVTNHCSDMKRLWKHMAGCTDTNCRVSHCFSSRSILSHYRKCKDPHCKACGPVRDTVKKSNGQAVTISASSMSAYGYDQSSSSQGGGSSSGYGPSSSSGMQSGMMMPMGPPESAADYPGDKSRLRHKQQRLLLLRHASKCPYPEGQCPVTAMCGGMKKLWRHISDCKDQTCAVQHCMSSRYVLSHYRRCKHEGCVACEPVREVIRRSQAKAQAAPGGGNRKSLAADFEAQLLNSALRDMPPMESGAYSAYSGQQHGMVPNMSSSSYQGGQSSSEQPPNKRARMTERIGDGRGGGGSTMVPPQAPQSTDRQMMPPGPESSSAAKSKSRKSDDSSKASSTKSEDVGSFSLMNSFTVEQIEKHLASLNRTSTLSPAEIKAKCLDLLKVVMHHEHGWVFNVPVDPVELGLPDYLDIIKKPMDLGTIQKKLDRGDNGQYHSLDEFCADVHLTFDNAILYNEEGSVVHTMAKQLKDIFSMEHKKTMAGIMKEEEERKQNERVCGLCGCEKLLFEPPVYFCNGMNCASKRIRRNSNYYIGGGNQYFWCTTCFNELDGKIPIEVGDLSMQKAELVKKKNDEVHEESWVQCDTCERWIHQICGLFNLRQNKEHKSEYSCPACLLKKRRRQKKKKEDQAPACSLPGAEALPRTKLSEILENHVRTKVDEKIKSLAEEKAKADNIPFNEAMKATQLGGPITIRQVTSTDRKLDVREGMLKRYKHKNYPEEFPFRCKCIVVFQNVDGVDVILFALYVYEHGDDNPHPNKKTVYISYLDSVHFMRPRRIRTFVYHEILICYLDYVRNKGFKTAHIWACPPLKGDDYIFYAKPEDQKTPKDTRLRMWYIDMLVECQRRNICGKVTNMHDEYFANPKLDASDVPYLEGDYFPGEAENIIAELNKGKGKNKKGSKSKKKKSGNASDDTGVSGDAKGPDEVMVKLGEIIAPMKESFIVAYLNCEGAPEENLKVPKAIMEHRAKVAEEEKANGKSSDSSSNRKRDANGNVKSDSVDKDGAPIKIIDDDVEELDCEFLNNRQAFLNLCRGNHYQFDELRRAKHTSMMVLWHLHNRGAPKFVQSCGSCGKEILSGYRWHCNTCPDFDLCTECYKSPSTNRGQCTHKMEAIPVEGGGADDSGGSGLTEHQRRERQRNIQLHIQLSEHASRCNAQNCASQNCAKMKHYLMHSKQCKIKASGGCKICKRIWTLLRIHASHCKLRDCPMPSCNTIRERLRLLKKQQQQMDDRRRQEMNRHFQMMRAQAGAR